VGFKWFVDGLLDGSLGFAGEESAGACFLRRNGRVWTTDKDGMAPALLAAEITARLGRDPAEVYRQLVQDLGEPVEQRLQAVATPKQKARLAQLSPRQLRHTELGGECIRQVLDRAPGNDARIGGLKIVTESAWVAARPSGTEDVYKIYAESFRGRKHLRRIVEEAQAMVDAALALGSAPAKRGRKALDPGARG
jgi:phosphoglucomutase